MTADVLTGFVVNKQEHERTHGWARCFLVSACHEGQMAIMSRKVIRLSTMKGTIGGEVDSVAERRSALRCLMADDGSIGEEDATEEGTDGEEDAAVDDWTSVLTRCGGEDGRRCGLAGLL